MRVRQPGRYELAFSSGADAETLLSLRDTVELFDGELSCEWELETGQLAGLVEPDGMGSVPALVHAYWELEGERWALGVLRVSSEGAFAGRVPYGVGQFVRPDAARASDPRMWSSLGRVEVPRDGVGLAQLR